MLDSGRCVENRFGLHDTDVMPMFMIVALDIFIIMRSSINCTGVICSPTVIHVILREATSETYGPRVSFLLYCISFIYIASCLLFCNLYFPIYTTKYQKYLSYYLYLISLSQVIVKGLTTPLSRWLQGSWLFVQVLGDLCDVSNWIDTLVLKTEGNTYATLLHHPFLFKGKPTHAQEVPRRISGAVAGEIYAKSRHTKYPS